MNKDQLASKTSFQSPLVWSLKTGSTVIRFFFIFDPREQNIATSRNTPE